MVFNNTLVGVVFTDKVELFVGVANRGSRVGEVIGIDIGGVFVAKVTIVGARSLVGNLVELGATRDVVQVVKNSMIRNRVVCQQNLCVFPIYCLRIYFNQLHIYFLSRTFHKYICMNSPKIIARILRWSPSSDLVT